PMDLNSLMGNNASAPPPTPPRFSRQISSTFLSGIDRIVETDARARLARSAAAVSLAAQLYRADHDGHWPPSLDVLVPAYLPAVPRDVYASGESMGYRILPHARPDGQDRPIIYSVGTDGIDDTAADPSTV